ncbi:hypothetical protein H1P_1480012 [Hyella patelloides LEGE 07179]|uniref:Uncharacterized protein n=1 Tax=Hyella patelloides LEGE 07179 TaxID=945734 RepID=A0A563VLT5_9CYAN|nr:hypothetical protein H1P_1480012 [Hyella patelloides LEGE 07179]
MIVRDASIPFADPVTMLITFIVLKNDNQLKAPKL